MPIYPYFIDIKKITFNTRNLIMYYHIIKFVKFTHDIKVRLQTMPPIKPGETPLYKGTFDCAMQTIRKEVGWTFNIMDL